MTTLTLEMPEEAFSTFNVEPADFAKQMRIAAAIKWFETGRISQNRAAEIAGLSRADFITALSEANVSVLQITSSQLADELRNAD
ncbi:MAG: UPF0175 family protein [Desulfurivibrio sp.]|nr:UPF0175 family protein [Desulfurivibrio sp.]